MSRKPLALQSLLFSFSSLCFVLRFSLLLCVCVCFHHFSRTLMKGSAEKNACFFGWSFLLKFFCHKRTSLRLEGQGDQTIVTKLHTCAGTPCRATRVAADFLRILGFFRRSSSIALHPPTRRCRTCRPWTARSVARQAASEKVSRYRGV